MGILVFSTLPNEYCVMMSGDWPSVMLCDGYSPATLSLFSVENIMFSSTDPTYDKVDGDSMVCCARRFICSFLRAL